MKKILDLLTKVLGFVMGLLVLASVVVVTMQIIWRYVFTNPLSWTEQIGRYLFVWIVLLAIPVGAYKGGMFAFDLLLGKLKNHTRVIVQTVNLVACEIFCGYYLYQSIMLCIKGGWRYAQGVHIPMIVLYIAQPICAASLILVFLYQLIENWKSWERLPARKEAK